MNLNKGLLLRVKDRVLGDPGAFDMVEYLVVGGYTVLHDRLSAYRDFPACQTSACLAGWAHVLSRGETDPGKAWDGFSIDRARALLGFDWGEDSDFLFHSYDWEGDYGERYERARSPEERARVAAEYLDYVVEKYCRD